VDARLPTSVCALRGHQVDARNLLPTPVRVPPFATFAVPFWWMLRENQRSIDESLPSPLPLTRSLHSRRISFWPRPSGALLETFFLRLTSERSLVFFYTKEGHPLVITSRGSSSVLGQFSQLDHSSDTKSVSPSYPFWDRLIRHPSASTGPTACFSPTTSISPRSATRRNGATPRTPREIAVTPPSSERRQFSYSAELLLLTRRSPSSLGCLLRCGATGTRDRGRRLGRARRVAQRSDLDGVARPWCFSGTRVGAGSARNATRDCTCARSRIERTYCSGTDPWPIVDAVMRGRTSPPDEAFRADLDAIRRT